MSWSASISTVCRSIVNRRAATRYTVFETARLNGLDPEAYLADVLDRMAKGHPINWLDDLLPWNWRVEPAKMAA
jgi:transposase